MIPVLRVSSKHDPVDPPPIGQSDFLLGGGIAAVTVSQKRNILATVRRADQEIATGGTRPEHLLLATPQYLSRNKLDVRLGSAACVIDPSSHTVVDQSGAAYR
jgi:hypothetical protein